MRKRVLMVATVPSMIGQFNMNNIQLLLEMGYQVDVATNFKDSSVWTKGRIKQLIDELKIKGVKCFQIDFSRNSIDCGCHIRSYRRILDLIKKRKYSLIHTHTPVASAIVRLAAHKTKTKVIYTAHGFHFFKGAPLKNWIFFYPVEKWLSRYTDILITINKEDYRRAKKNLKAQKTVYVPGVGVDTKKFAPRPGGREKIRKELNLSDNQIMLLSVGELNENKNHISVIKAIKDTDYVYVIVGKGEKKFELESAAKKSNVDLRLMGYRGDVSDFYNAADVYVLPSLREGLNVSLMEAMASKLPVACSNIRGDVDLISEFLFNPRDFNDIKISIKKAVDNQEKLGRRNKKKIESFDILKVNNLLTEIYWEEIVRNSNLNKYEKKQME